MTIRPPGISGIADYRKARLQIHPEGSVPASAVRAGLQPGDPMLDALAALDDTPGILVQTGANTLAKAIYVSGTFTPTIVGSSSAGAGTYSAQRGFGTQVGNVFTFSLTVQWSAHTGTGLMRVGGFPISPVATDSVVFATTAINLTGATSPAVVWTGFVFNVVNAETNVGISMDTAATLIVSGSYFV